jgi:hypothetical protein
MNTTVLFGFNDQEVPIDVEEIVEVAVARLLGGLDIYDFVQRFLTIGDSRDGLAAYLEEIEEVDGYRADTGYGHVLVRPSLVGVNPGDLVHVQIEWMSHKCDYDFWRLQADKDLKASCHALIKTQVEAALPKFATLKSFYTNTNKSNGCSGIVLDIELFRPEVRPCVFDACRIKDIAMSAMWFVQKALSPSGGAGGAGGGAGDGDKQ